MTIYQFRASPPHLQHAIVEARGVFLLAKSSGGWTGRLYQVDGFYVEILYAAHYQSMGIIKCRSVAEIKPYLSQIDLSSIHNLLP